MTMLHHLRLPSLIAAVFLLAPATPGAAAEIKVLNANALTIAMKVWTLQDRMQSAWWGDCEIRSAPRLTLTHQRPAPSTFHSSVPVTWWRSGSLGRAARSSKNAITLAALVVTVVLTR